MRFILRQPPYFKLVKDTSYLSLTGRLWGVLCEYCCENRPSQIARFMGPTWGPPGSCRPPMGPMFAPWTLLSGMWYQDSKVCAILALSHHPIIHDVANTLPCQIWYSICEEIAIEIVSAVCRVLLKVADIIMVAHTNSSTIPTVIEWII